MISPSSDFSLKATLQRLRFPSSEAPIKAASTVGKNARVLKLLKKAPKELKVETEDLMLEVEGDIRAFLKGAKTSTDSSIRYNDKGKLVPYSVVGPPSLFENQSVPKYKPQPTFSTPTSPTGCLRFFPLVRKQILKIDYERKFKDRLLQIDESHKKGQERERERLKTLNLEDRLRITKEQRAIKLFQDTQEHWNRIDNGLCKKIKKPKEELLQSRAYEYREKLEELDVIEKVRSLEASNRYGWYMSLRGDPKIDKLEAFVNVGNYMTGLYTRIRERSNSYQSIIKKPGMSKTSHKTFRDDPYFKDTVKSNDLYSSINHARSIRPEDLNVVGMKKLPLEIDAVKSAGVDLLKTELIAKGDEGEEIIFEQYSPRSLAYTSKTAFRM